MLRGRIPPIGGCLHLAAIVTMTKSKRGKDGKAGGATPTDNRKPKHSLDGNRPSKGAGGQRDAATVRASMA